MEERGFFSVGRSIYYSKKLRCYQKQAEKKTQTNSNKKLGRIIALLRQKGFLLLFPGKNMNSNTLTSLE